MSRPSTEPSHEDSQLVSSTVRRFGAEAVAHEAGTHELTVLRVAAGAPVIRSSLKVVTDAARRLSNGSYAMTV